LHQIGAFLLPYFASYQSTMSEPQKNAPSTSKPETAPKDEGGCCFKKYLPSFGGDSGYKWIIPTVTVVAVGAIAVHIYLKHRGGGQCC